MTVNLVDPTGSFYAADSPYRFFGNRGAIHRERRIVKTHANPRWIVCVTDNLGPPETFMGTGTHTELFFVDEATAFAAGHRPCFRCRHGDATRYLELWREVVDDAVRIDDVDVRLHQERLDEAGNQRTYVDATDRLPDGVMVKIDDVPFLVWDGRLHKWTPAGYRSTRARGGDPVEVLTPPSTVAVLAAGYPVHVAC